MAGRPPDPYGGGPGPPMDMGFDDNMGSGGGLPPGGGDYGDPYPPMGPQGFPGDTDGMPDAGMGAGGQGAVAPAEGDIGPFVRPILNKLVRIFSALTSLVALILQFMILGQGITTYMKSIQPSKTSKEKQENKASKEDKDETAEEEVVEEEGENEEPESSTRPDRNTDEITTTRRTSSRTSRSTTRSRSSTTLLGVERRDVLPTPDNLFPIPTSTAAHLVKRNNLQVRQNNPSRSTLTVSPSSNNYVPNSDVPLRDGAVGFTASSHLFAAFVILLLFWLEFMLFMKKPTMLTYWGPLIIACVQLYMAFDILGRVLDAAGQAGGYVLLLMAIANVFLAGWTVLQGKKHNAPAPMQDMAGPMNGGAPMDGDFGDPYGDSNGSLPPVGDGAPPDHFDADGMNDGFVEEKIGGLPGDPEADLQPGSEEQAGAEGDQSPGASSTSSASSRTRHRRRRKKKRRATTGGSYISDDIDPYYDTDRRHSYNYGSRYPPPGQNYIIPPVQHMSQVNEDYVATTPISLYGPNEYRRRLEEKRRTRRQSLIQPAMEFDPTTGRYIEPAGRFNARTQQMLPGLQEEDVDDADMQVQLRAADPRFRQDGFANRTKVWKRLQGGDPGMIL